MKEMGSKDQKTQKIQTSKSLKRRSPKRSGRKLHMAAALCAIAFLFAMSGNFFASAKESTEGEVYKYYKSIYIEEGDSLWSIAEQYKTADCDSVRQYVRTLMKINNLQDDRIRFGERLIVAYDSSVPLE